MPEDVEYRCFIGNLSWSTSDRGLKDAFEKFGNLIEAKMFTYASIWGEGNAKPERHNYLDDRNMFYGTKLVAVDKISGRSRGFGFISFDEKAAMEEAIEAMNGMDLDGRNITVDRAKPQQGSGRDYDGDRNRGRDRDHDRNRGYDGGRGSNGGECFKCGKPGHFARECPSDGARGGKYGGRGDRHGGGGGRYGPDRNGDRFGGRSRDAGSRGGSGSDRYNRDRSGPYDRRGTGGPRSG
ncbi:hypothetical protein Godav_017161 [Gossypium davidsonii]|uniref:Uncharacterized protein n=3 Tax=Gossypium TaxID=3633 RepID=A0A7J8QSE6_GOSDV|nr:hypothetical protein [Gossypium lobatum]MBA0604504.1 hypothetical protein [Gossypium davidsonii]MBA0639392.1 hypothetical protein [Gossypium klotzschianum]